MGKSHFENFILVERIFFHSKKLKEKVTKNKLQTAFKKHFVLKSTFEYLSFACMSFSKLF